MSPSPLMYADLTCECGQVTRLYHLQVAGCVCSGCEQTLWIGEDILSDPEEREGDNADDV